jgi:hypothetical protein
MISHLTYAVGILGDLLILIVLFARRRVPRFPWFTLLIAVHFLLAIGLKAIPRLSGHAISGFTATIVDLTDMLLRCGVLAELTWIALLPVARLRWLTLLLLLAAGAVLIVMGLTPSDHTLRLSPVLMHLLLSVLAAEWAIVLAFLLRPLRLSWRSHVAAISFGYGVFSAVDLAAGGYFKTGHLGDVVSSPYFRLPVYLLILLWWSVSLWLAEPLVRIRAN